MTDGAVRNHGIGATLYVNRSGKTKLAGFFSAKLQKRQTSWLPCEIEALAITVAIRHFSPYIVQSLETTYILTDSKPCVQAYEKLCRGEFSLSPRVSTFLTAVSRYQAIVKHIAGTANLLSDHASRNAPQCHEQSCQLCTFITKMESCVVRQSDIDDILNGQAKLPFMSRKAWITIQSECPDLRRTHAHLTQGTRPSKKLTNIRDVKRYLNIASIAHDGLLVVKRTEPFHSHRECVIIPRHVLDGMLTSLHIQLNHPTQHQLKKVAQRYIFALDLEKAIDNISDRCHQCASLRATPRHIIKQSTSDPPAGVGISFAADILRRNRQLILVVRETVTSFTLTRLISCERQEELRDTLICLCSDLTPLQGPFAVIRVTAAPGFQALAEDKILQQNHLQFEIGRVKNPNHNPVAERAIQELESELRRQLPRGEPLTSSLLAITTARLNSRIRTNGLSAREMWFQRDQLTNEQLPIRDLDRIIEQHNQRLDNHQPSEASKCPKKIPPETTPINTGDIVYLYREGSKHEARSRYVVTSIDANWCCIRKFTGEQLRNVSYKVKKSEIYKVPSEFIPNPQERNTNDERLQVPSVPTLEPSSHDLIPPEISSTDPPLISPQPHRPLGHQADRPAEEPSQVSDTTSITDTTQTLPTDDQLSALDRHASPADSPPTESPMPTAHKPSRRHKKPTWLEDYTE